MANTEAHVRLFFKGTALLVPMTFVLNQHPGGAEYLLQYANQDITAAFEEMNHSAQALELLHTFEETTENAGKTVYSADRDQCVTKASKSVDEESRRIAEMRWWLLRQRLVTAASTVAAMGLVAFALRRHAQRS